MHTHMHTHIHTQTQTHTHTHTRTQTHTNLYKKIGEDVEEEKKEGPSPEQMLREFKEKLEIVGAAKTGSSLGVYSLLNEIKDKSE